MLISLNWIRDFVDLPANLDPHELAERFTLTTAEVEEVRPINVDARGLIVARIITATNIPDARHLRLVVLDVGDGKTVETVSAAPVLPPGAQVVYAPPGARLVGMGDIATATVAGKRSTGMILPGDAVGIALAVQEAVFVSAAIAPGTPLDPGQFDDWIIEVDNKSLTHRPDLWGHYGIAREMAAICDRPLKPYPVAPISALQDEDLPEVPILIADAEASPRYSALVLSGAGTQPGPLWMQLRLGHVGMRPISGLVDLTNYIMADLGQPMHAFDGDKVDRIEVDWAKEGEVFRTLDGVDRTLGAKTLMIKSDGRSIALAGVMGGLETEVSDTTELLLLESANFEPATIRRTATALGLRTDASARFEKSLDPANTVLAIRRFVQLAAAQYPEMKIVKRLSDGYPNQAMPTTIRVRPQHIARTVGRAVLTDEVTGILSPLGFSVRDDGDTLDVSVPSFRATGDVGIEADVIEEIARSIGFGAIEERMPRVTVRRVAQNVLHDIEQQTLRHITTVHGFNEIHGYLWYDSAFLEQLGFDPGLCVELANPPAAGQGRMRQTLMPGLLASVVKNRFHFASLSIVELGSVFEAGDDGDMEHRHIGLIKARRGKKAESDLLADLKAAIESWAWTRFTTPVSFVAAPANAARPWESPDRTCAIQLAGSDVGRVSVVGMGPRRAMDEHLGAWSIAWAEIRLNGLDKIDATAERLGTISPHPRVELDFSIVAPSTATYASVADKLRVFEHDLLKRIAYVGSYEGKSVGRNLRSLTFRVVLGDDARTLTDSDSGGFTSAFETYVAECGFELRK